MKPRVRRVHCGGVQEIGYNPYRNSYCGHAGHFIAIVNKVNRTFYYGGPVVPDTHYSLIIKDLRCGLCERLGASTIAKLKIKKAQEWATVVETMLHKIAEVCGDWRWGKKK